MMIGGLIFIEKGQGSENIEKLEEWKD
jgi:hypothetical protein